MLEINCREEKKRFDECEIMKNLDKNVPLTTGSFTIDS